jgi:hypothetical protein
MVMDWSVRLFILATVVLCDEEDKESLQQKIHPSSFVIVVAIES